MENEKSELPLLHALRYLFVRKYVRLEYKDLPVPPRAGSQA